MKRLRAFTQTDVLVAVAITLLVGFALATVQYVSGTSEDLSTGISGSESHTRAVLDTMADELRIAQPCITGMPPVSSAVAAGTPTSITIYTNGSGAATTYYLDASKGTGRLMRRIGTSDATVLLPNVAMVNFSYLLSAAYNAPAGGWTSPLGKNLTPSELPRVGAVVITTTVTYNLGWSYSRTLSTKVRLRNSPLP